MRGLLIDYRYCTGCHSCEVACQQEKGLPADKSGIFVKQQGPTIYGDGDYEYSFMPMPTKLCDLCEERVGKGQRPACVHHCMSACMQFGDIVELAQSVTTPKQVIFAIS